MANQDLLKQIESGVMKLTLNRPEALNAFSEDMITGLIDSIREAKQSEEVKVVVIHGAGRAFSSGGDVKSMGKTSGVEVYEFVGILNELILEIKSINKPVVASVHGVAAGAGFNLALACDLIVASEECKFILSFAQVGLISDGGGLFFLPHVLGPYRTKELLFSGKPLEATKAKDWGVVNEVVPLEQLNEVTETLSLQLANGPTKAIGLMKQIADDAATMTLENVLRREQITQAMMVTTEDHLEGVRAFVEKRKPNFQGK
ncbi:enoyl-CoA hydratase/isomerase family protein [Alkalihalobacterium elongatum]|uniref:enoyl-CoA hydratase/isomerase family protein n=1 Tax=Alkalihalobacterium elongatum TaxID=2675466 RepID=UPI001C1F4B82|nr:enoyl-CoA hydratase [Alkalihalobacterium elongatum]